MNFEVLADDVEDGVVIDLGDATFVAHLLLVAHAVEPLSDDQHPSNPH